MLYVKLKDFKGIPFDRDSTWYVELDMDGMVKKTPKINVIGSPMWSEEFIFVSLIDAPKQHGSTPGLAV